VGSVAGLLPLISCKPTKLLLQRQRPLLLGLAQAAAHHAAATSAAASSLLYPLLYCTVLNSTELKKGRKYC